MPWPDVWVSSPDDDVSCRGGDGGAVAGDRPVGPSRGRPRPRTGGLRAADAPRRAVGGGGLAPRGRPRHATPGRHARPVFIGLVGWRRVSAVLVRAAVLPGFLLVAVLVPDFHAAFWGGGKPTVRPDCPTTSHPGWPWPRSSATAPWCRAARAVSSMVRWPWVWDSWPIAGVVTCGASSGWRRWSWPPGRCSKRSWCPTT